MDPENNKNPPMEDEDLDGFSSDSDNTVIEADEDKLLASTQEDKGKIISWKIIQLYNIYILLDSETDRQQAGNTPLVSDDAVKSHCVPGKTPDTTKVSNGKEVQLKRKKQMFISSFITDEERNFNPNVNVKNPNSSNAYKDAVSRERAARRKKERYEKMDPSKLTTWEKGDYNRAISVLNDKTLKDILESKNKSRQEVQSRKNMLQMESSLQRWSFSDNEEELSMKRKRSEDEETLKKIKRSKPRSSKDEDDKLRVFVLNLKSNDDKITSEQWIETEGAIQDAICDFYDNIDEDIPDLEPDFQGLNYDKDTGHKVIACCNSFVAKWIMGVINNLPKSDTLERKAVYLEDMENHVRPTASIWIPPPVRSEEKVLELLKKQNRWLKTDGWIAKKRVIKEGSSDNNVAGRPGEKFFLVLTRESIPALRERNFVVKYSMAKAVIYLKGSKSEEEDGDSEALEK